ncbi:hypothetical protein BJ684DRAFT_15178 [Piptocephalis cylindrospora]|uniref:Uncharacterized protein n=1 Tax=Piptocephalis cylindrospora TaxID=1907219 RepID=A0A4P9Y617_9FUNG|nr:hypothetical protein BJ684DRAFT_15178 [Piptocephalis cylindrospora]|eukprot:RKP14506.1 hypothetical protein BJ684DRAFT_15178 [Piptocephalis cylindrospora]
MAQAYFSTLDLDLDYQGSSTSTSHLVVQPGEGGSLGKTLTGTILMVPCKDPTVVGSHLSESPAPVLSFASSSSSSSSSSVPIAQVYQLPSTLILAYSASTLSSLTVPLAEYLVKQYPQCTWWVPSDPSSEANRPMYKSFCAAEASSSLGTMSSSLTMDGLPAALITEIEMMHGAGMAMIKESNLPSGLASLTLPSTSLMTPNHLYT